MPTLKGMDPGRWLTSKDASVYERQLTFDVSLWVLKLQGKNYYKL
jgi:hypothetical protein